MSELPPLPKGFVLDDSQQASAAAPPLPTGFTLDAQPSSAADFVQSMPRGGVTGALTPLSWAAQLGKPEIDAMSMTGTGKETGVAAPSAEGMTQLVEQGVTGPMHQPQTRAGQYGASIGQGLGNPLSYLGPGGLGLKIGGSILSSVGSEAGGQAFEGTKFEGPAKLAGGLAGGVAAVKALGPKAAKAAAPTYDELKAAANSDYTAARNSGLELNPKGPATFAATAEQELTALGHTGGPNGTAPGTFAVLDSLQNAPAGATITASNLDSIRKNLALRARATSEGKPTPDAAAASVVLDRFNKYVENPDQNHILAGSAEDYVRATKQGNANYAASQRVRTIDLKRARAENNAEGGIATAIDNQLKSQMRTILNNPKAQRGFSGDELAAIGGVNKGTLASNTLRQAGRMGAGVIPAIAHIGAAIGTGGASILPQIGLAAGLYGARKGAEAMTVSRAKKLAEMLAKRSPEYQARVLGLPDISTLPNKAQMIRVLMSGVGSL